MILPDATAISSQYPFHFDTCGGKIASKVRQTTTEGLDEPMAKARKRDGVAKRGTVSHRGRGKGSGGTMKCRIARGSPVCTAYGRGTEKLEDLS